MRKRAYVHVKFDYILDFELKFHNFVPINIMYQWNLYN